MGRSMEKENSQVPCGSPGLVSGYPPVLGFQSKDQIEIAEKRGGAVSRAEIQLGEESGRCGVEAVMGGDKI